MEGYVSNIGIDTMTGQQVISAYDDLWLVERSFRMTKNDLRARPIFHHQRESIEAHLTIAFAALAISRHIQDTTDMSIKKLVPDAAAAPGTAQINVGGHIITAAPQITSDARDILDQLPPINAPGALVGRDL